jgi:hypothetical protein
MLEIHWPLGPEVRFPDNPLRISCDLQYFSVFSQPVNLMPFTLDCLTSLLFSNRIE